MWRENPDAPGELVFPFNRDRPEDRLRVWPLLPGTDHEGWYGDVVFDGERVAPLRVGPFLTREEARDDLIRRLVAVALAVGGVP